jgi:hypothetical protein
MQEEGQMTMMMRLAKQQEQQAAVKLRDEIGCSNNPSKRSEEFPPRIFRVPSERYCRI